MSRIVLAPKRTVLVFAGLRGAWRLFELVVQGWLEDPDVKHVLAQRDRSGVRGDEVADDFGAELARNLGIDLPLARATKEQYRPHDSRKPRRPRQVRHRRAHIQRPPKLPAIACDSFGTVEPSGPAKPKAQKGRILLQSLSIRIGQANLPEPVLLVLHEPLRSERTVGLAN